MRAAMSSPVVATARASSGREAPISVVGSTRPAKHSAKMSGAASTWPARSVASQSYRNALDSRAKAPTPTSAIAKPISARAGVRRSAIFAPMMEPSPSPARKAPTTSAAEMVSDPAKIPSIRCQTIWHSKAANPVAKNAVARRGIIASDPQERRRPPQAHPILDRRTWRQNYGRVTLTRAGLLVRRGAAAAPPSG